MTELLSACILEEKSEDGITMVNGKPFMADAKGSLVPLELVKPADKLEDEVVRKIMGYAVSLSDQVSRFREHTMGDLGDYDALIEQEYGLKKGGKKGNRTYQSFDGLKKVTVQISDLISFGSQLQVAKRILDDLLMEWAADSRPEIQALITRAFNTDKEGHVRQAEMFRLLRLEIADPRWLEAMRAIRDAQRTDSSKEYVRFYERSSVEDSWTAVSIDLARA